MVRLILKEAALFMALSVDVRAEIVSNVSARTRPECGTVSVTTRTVAIRRVRTNKGFGPMSF